ncbi:MAG: hypothetical protein ACUVX8_13205, partial [Candidatus Zipacnadales bacterium]
LNSIPPSEDGGETTEIVAELWCCGLTNGGRFGHQRRCLCRWICLGCGVLTRHRMFDRGALKA